MRLSEAEFERRASLLQGILAEQELDALILASNDYRGHKGALRWVGDYNLAHRYGYAFVARDRPPELVIPHNLALGRPPDRDIPIRYPRNTAEGLREAIAELGTVRRVGIAGLGQVMRIEEYQHLRDNLPGVELIDSSEAFERVRAVKSEEELAGIREATDIAERCFERLVEITRPGVTERQLGAEMYRVAYQSGGEDPLFLSMYSERGPSDEMQPRFSAPTDRILTSEDQLIFSFELVGPRGYWMELARMIVIGRPNESQQRLNVAVREGMDGAARAMKPGARPEDVQQAVLDAAERHGGRPSYWSGHGIGQDVIEEPWIGLEVVEDRTGGDSAAWTIEEGMALSMHPFVADSGGRGIGYMSNVYLVGSEGASAASELDLSLYRV